MSTTSNKRVTRAASRAASSRPASEDRELSRPNTPTRTSRQGTPARGRAASPGVADDENVPKQVRRLAEDFPTLDCSLFEELMLTRMR